VAGVPPATGIAQGAREQRLALRVPDTVSELCIAHTQKGLHKIYDQHAYLDEKRNAFDAWANHVLAICEPGMPSNVIQIAARG
jgi:hypothetical protein